MFVIRQSEKGAIVVVHTNRCTYFKGTESITGSKETRSMEKQKIQTGEGKKDSANIFFLLSVVKQFDIILYS